MFADVGGEGVALSVENGQFGRQDATGIVSRHQRSRQGSRGVNDPISRVVAQYSSATFMQVVVSAAVVQVQAY